MADPKIKYDIEANVKGDAEVGQLASQLEALAKTLDGDLKTNANAAAAALRQLGDKQTAIQRFIELKTEGRAAASALLQTQLAAEKLGQELAASANPTNKQAGALQKLYDQVKSGTQAVEANKAAMQQARGALQQYGVSTQNLSQSQQAVKAAVGAAKLEVNALVPAYAQAGQQATASANQQKQANAGVGKSVTDIGDQLRKIQNIAMIAVGGGFLGGIAKDALKTADEFNNLQARIKLVTGEGALLTSSFQAVSDIALRTNSNLEQTVTLFARVAESGKSAGLSTQQAAAQSLALTETINQSIQLSGGSAESSSAAITQLIQALQSGVLRGEEFNSIMEQSPRLAKALADGLGVTTGELRKMAEAGSLTTDTVIRSLRSQSDTIKAEFASLPPTVGRAIENLNTSWTSFVGNLDKGAGISKTVAGAIDSLAGNLTTVLTVAGHAAVAWGGYTLSQKLAAAGATQSAIAVEQAALAATGQAAASGRAAVSTSAHGKAAALAAVEVAGYGAANTAAAAATNANTAQVAASATGYRAAGGAVLSAASKFALWGTVAYEGYGILKSVGTALGEGVAKWQGYKNAEEVMAEQEKKLAAATQATADAQFKQSEAMRLAKDASFGLSKEAGLLSAKFDKLVKDGDSAAEAIGKIGKDFDLSKLPGILNAAGVLDRLKTDGKLTATEFQAAWATALNGKDLAIFETTARAAFKGTKREAELLAELIDAGLRESVKRAGLDFENLRGGISKTAQSALNDTQTLIDGLDRLSAQGVDTGRVLVASLSKAIDTADGVEAINALLPKIETLRKELGEKITNGLLDQAEEKVVALDKALDKATPGINSLSEALEKLGVTSDVTFKTTALDAKAAYDAATKSGIASSRELGEAFKKAAEAAISANKGIAPSWVTAEAAVRGYKVQVDSTGKAIVSAMGSGSRAMSDFGGYTRQTTEDLKAQAAALDAINARYARPGAGGGGGGGGDKNNYDPGYGSPYARPGESPKNGNNQTKAEYDRGKFLAGQSAQDLTLQFSLLDKIQKKTLTAADLADAKAIVASLKVNNQTNQDLDKFGGAFSAAGALDRSKWETVQAQLQNFINAQESAGRAGKQAATPSTSTSTGNASSTTVNINLNGVTHPINTDAAGAATLQSVLAQLGAAKSTSAR